MSHRARIVVGVDPWGSSDDALAWAADEAEETGRPLHVLHAPAWSDAGPTAEPEPWDTIVAKAVSCVLEHHPDLTVTGETVTGSASGALIRASDDAGLVVIGAHPQGPWAAALWASLLQQVPMHARCPVAVVPPGWRAPGAAGRPVLVGVDGSEGSREALRYAAERASRTGERVRAMHCVWPADADGPLVTTPALTQERALVDLAAVDVGAQWPQVDLAPQTVPGAPAESLLGLSQSASLLVVGSRGRGGFTGLLLGSVASRLVGLTGCPLVVARDRPSPS